MFFLESKEARQVLSRLVKAHQAWVKARETWEAVREEFLRLGINYAEGYTPSLGKVIVTVDERLSTSYSLAVKDAKSLLERALESRDWFLVERALMLLSNPPASVAKVVKILYNK